MITQNQIKFIRSLHQKKFRDEHRQYIVEGPKIIGELLQTDIPIISLFARKTWIEKNQKIISDKNIDVLEISENEHSRISNLTAPNQVLAVMDIPEPIEINEKDFNGIILALDQISDPGNLGTIIRTADWFGIKTIFCSDNCVELYNPKVIQATMGSYIRLNIIYSCLDKIFQKTQGKMTIYGAYTKGEALHKIEKKKNSILIIGNESKGISSDLEKYIQFKVAIPSLHIQGTDHAESLNASVAAALMCYEFTKSA